MLTQKQSDQVRQFLKQLNEEPDPLLVQKHEDGSFYLPISHTQNKVDDLFLGLWSFELLREQFGRKWGRGYGVLTVTHPVTGDKMTRGGDAAIHLTGNMRLDSPRLEAMVFLSCAKKFGKVLGRDLNRDKDDAPLPVIKTEKSGISNEGVRVKALMEACETVDELKTYVILAQQHKVKNIYESQMRKLKNDEKKKAGTPAKK